MLGGSVLRNGNLEPTDDFCYTGETLRKGNFLKGHHYRRDRDWTLVKETKIPHMDGGLGGDEQGGTTKWGSAGWGGLGRKQGGWTRVDS